jgi:probable phosphoglycerate mutase
VTFVTTPVAILRHGPTHWSAAKRLQGHADLPLSAQGRAVVARWHVPAPLDRWDWVTSPLARCRETAAILRGDSATGGGLVIEKRLIETHFGDWEGYTIAELRQRHGAEMAACEARGLDFEPPGGESRRVALKRLRSWLIDVSAAGRPTLALSHRGIIRLLYALATGWDMVDKPPDKLREGTVHLFDLDADGIPRVNRLNVPLAEAPAA